MTKFKVGDTVRVKSLEWYNKNKDEQGKVFYRGSYFYEFMSHLCGKTLIINRFYNVDGRDLEATSLGGIQYILCEWMLEDEPIKTTASLSPPFNHPFDPSLESQATTSTHHSSGSMPIDNSPIILSTEIDWEKRQFELVKAALPAFVQKGYGVETCASRSIELADMVIKKIKEQ